jgi:hypothetical protein
MFEYLMPALVMHSPPSTLLDQSYRGAVERQIAHGARRGVPWGVSESAYNLRDHKLTYQYRAFGVPDLGLKRGLGRDLVIAPYASALALHGRAGPRAGQPGRARRHGRARDRTASATPSTTPGRIREATTPWSATTWRTTSA